LVFPAAGTVAQAAAPDGWIFDCKTIVEHPNGIIKMIIGRFCFLLRSKPKVQIEMDINSTIYNLKGLISIENMDYLLKLAKKHNWSLTYNSG
jgi:hypothetical protein